MHISKAFANEIIQELNHLTDGGGVTAPDDMVDIDDVTNIILSFVPEDKKVEHHAELVEGLTDLYERKNADYGDSFGAGMQKYGMVMPMIRIVDKMNRLESLTRKGEQKVKDESVKDTLLDMANYSVMTVLELDRSAGQ